MVACLLLLAAPMPSLAAKAGPELGENEVKAGEEAAAEVVKEYKLSDNAADLKRVREIGAKLAAVANKKEVNAVYGSPAITPFQFKFDIIEDKDVNAFCIPGGHIYVYRGLLDFIESDQELALVMAHEVTHAAHHHMVYLLKKQATVENPEAIILLATILSGARSGDVYNIQRGLELLKIAMLSGYGMQAERDADTGAIYYAIEAGYNPVGLLTFMERLARKPEFIDYGIFRSHPLDEERVAAAKALLVKLEVPINRRATTKAVTAEVKTDKIDGVDVPGVVLSGKTIYRPAADSGKTSQQLAQAAADRINGAFDSGVKIHELKSDTSAGVVAARDTVLIRVSEADAKLMTSTVAQATQAASTAIRDVILMQMVDTIH
jgi:predicted Zn-dependent protease